MKKLFVVLLFVLFIWGILLRSVELINGNYLFGHDHGRDYLAAYSIVENHKLTLIGSEVGSGVAGISGLFHGPGYFYLISLAYVLFHGDPIGGQLCMFLFGIITMTAASWVGYKMMGKLGSLTLLFFVTVSPLIVSQSRFIWSVHPFTVFIVLALYFAFRIPDNPRLFAPLAIFAAGMTHHSQLGVAVPLTLTLMLSFPLIYRISDRRTYLYSFFVLILVYFPMIAFEARHGFMGTRSILSYVKNGGGTSSIFDSVRLSSHMINYLDNFTNTFTFEFGWIPRNIQLIMLWATLPVVGFGFLRNKVHKQRVFMFLIIFMFIFTWVFYLLLNNVIWDYYLTHLRIGVIFMYSLVFVSLVRSFHKSILEKLGIIVFIVFFVGVFVGSAFRQYISYTVDIHDLGVYEKILGKRYVIDEIYKDAQGEPFSVFVFMPSIYTYPYDYLFATYGKRKYGFEPTHEKKGLAYLIIEPDFSQPWRHNGWLETVVQGGETVWKKTLLNGLILEKRLYPL
jgi:hypothetical protein